MFVFRMDFVFFPIKPISSARSQVAFLTIVPQSTSSLKADLPFPVISPLVLSRRDSTLRFIDSEYELPLLYLGSPVFNFLIRPRVSWLFSFLPSLSLGLLEIPVRTDSSLEGFE